MSDYDPFDKRDCEYRAVLRERAAEQNRAARRLMDNLRPEQGLQTPAPFAAIAQQQGQGISQQQAVDFWARNRAGGQIAAPKASASKWIFAEGKHKRAVDANKFETMYVQYKSFGNWALIGTIGSSDILISSHKTEGEANGALTTILQSL